MLTIRKVMDVLRNKQDAEFHNYNNSIVRWDVCRDTFLLRDYVTCTSLGGGEEISAYKARKIINEMLNDSKHSIYKSCKLI